MKNTIEYKGYVGTVEFSEEDGVLFGKVTGIRSLISYEGTTVKELLEDFHGAIEDYLDICKSKGVFPEKPYKGSFNVRVSPELHRLAAMYAIENQTTLNSFVEDAMKNALIAKA